jgi:hypothetical protein
MPSHANSLPSLRKDLKNAVAALESIRVRELMALLGRVRAS